MRYTSAQAIGAVCLVGGGGLDQCWAQCGQDLITCMEENESH